MCGEVKIEHGLISLSELRESVFINRTKTEINRIEHQPKEVWAVKLADRITNLQKPPICHR